MEPLHKFRLHIKNKEFGLKAYFTVQLWERKIDMLSAAGYSYYGAHANTVFDVTPNGNRSRIITLNFWIKRLKAKYIVHELVHAVLEFCRWHKIDAINVGKDEELVCELLGELTRQFHKQLTKRGLQDLVIYG